MRLALDATALLGARTGIGVFTASVLERLAPRPGLDVTAFAATWRGRGGLAAQIPPGVRAVTRPLPARPARLLWRRVDWPPIEWWTGAVDVVHGPNFVVPPTRHAARVATVHDLTCVRHPELCTPDTLAYPDLLRRAIDAGAWIHAVSAFVASEVCEVLGADPDRVVAIPNGVSAGAPGVADTGRALAGGDRYVLALGTIEPRKDLPTLVRAFDRLAADDPSVRLVVAGGAGWGADAFDAAVAAAHHRDRIVVTGYVDDRTRADLLAGAAVLAYPSIYEGFGLPPLEAMLAGVPVVASAAGAVPEVVGDAALLVAPRDADALAAELHRALTDAPVAADLVRRGHARAAHYSWEACTDGLVALYDRARGG